MHRKTVWIEISTEWLEFGVVARGRVGAVHRVLIDPDGSPKRARDQATGVPANLRQHIGHGLSMLGVTRAGVNVLWHATGPCVDVHTVAASPGAATGAATLAFSMANALDQQCWSMGAHVVATRKMGRESHETSVLVSGVHHDVLREIEQAVEEAGCTLQTVIPAPSVAILLASEEAIDASRSSAEPVICLHVAEEATAIAIASEEVLLLARTIEMGYATLRHAYLRAIRASHASHPEAFLAAHKRLLETDGIPSPKNRDAIEIFEYVRPYLQRLFIEIKQTVRFTLEEDKLSCARVRLAGPGAAIPRLAAMLGEEVGFESVDAPPTRDAASEPGFGIVEGIRAGGARLGIQPPGRVERHERSSRRAALLYGAVGASIILAGAAYLSLHGAVASERRARTLDQELASWRDQANAGNGLNPKVLTESLEALIQSDSGQRADWGAALAEIVASRPEDVLLTGVSGDRDRDGSHLQLQALIPADDADSDPHERITEFVGALQAGGLVTETRLGATEQVDLGSHRFLQFSLTMNLVETKAPWFAAEVAP